MPGLLKFDPGQRRDAHGRWADEGSAQTSTSTTSWGTAGKIALGAAAVGLGGLAAYHYRGEVGDVLSRLRTQANNTVEGLKLRFAQHAPHAVEFDGTTKELHVETDPVVLGGYQARIQAAEQEHDDLLAQVNRGSEAFRQSEAAQAGRDAAVRAASERAAHLAQELRSRPDTWGDRSEIGRTPHFQSPNAVEHVTVFGPRRDDPPEARTETSYAARGHSTFRVRKAWDPTDHPRYPAGDTHGGEFMPSDGLHGQSPEHPSVYIDLRGAGADKPPAGQRTSGEVKPKSDSVLGQVFDWALEHPIETALAGAALGTLYSSKWNVDRVGWKAGGALAGAGLGAVRGAKLLGLFPGGAVAGSALGAIVGGVLGWHSGDVGHSVAGGISDASGVWDRLWGKDEPPSLGEQVQTFVARNPGVSAGLGTIAALSVADILRDGRERKRQRERLGAYAALPPAPPPHLPYQPGY